MESDIRHFGVRANGVELHVAEAGPKYGPLLVLLHGFLELPPSRAAGSVPGART